eukprot:g4884.t1
MPSNVLTAISLQWLFLGLGLLLSFPSVDLSVAVGRAGRGTLGGYGRSLSTNEGVARYTGITWVFKFFGFSSLPLAGKLRVEINLRSSTCVVADVMYESGWDDNYFDELYSYMDSNSLATANKAVRLLSHWLRRRSQLHEYFHVTHFNSALQTSMGVLKTRAISRTVCPSC